MTPDLTSVWRKSSRSGGEGGNCVELARKPSAVRDSKNPLEVLDLPDTRLVGFLTAVKAGRFDS